MPLKTKLTILFSAFTLIPIILFGIIISSRTGAILEAVRIAQLNTLADHLQDKIDTYFQERSDDIRTAQAMPGISEHLSVLNAYQRERAHPAYLRARNSLNRLMRPFLSVPGHIDIMLANEQGTIVFDSNPSHTGKQPEVQSRIVLDQGRKGVYFTDVFRSAEAEGQPVILGMAPLWDGRGAIIFEIDMRQIYSFLWENTSMGSTGEAFIARKEGSSVLFLSPLNHIADAEMRLRVDLNDTMAHAAQLAASGQTGSGFTRDYRGTDVLAAWRYLPSLRWGLVAKINTDEVFATMHELRLISIVAGVFMIGLAFVIATAIAGAVTGPIRRLQQGAEAVAAGDLGQRVGIAANDEIGNLSRTFDAMTAFLQQDRTARRQAEQELRSLNEDLEQHVRERTARLAEQSRRLDAFFRHSIMPLVFLDREFNYLKVNEAYARACSRAVDDFRGHNHFVDYPSGELREAFTGVVRTKMPFSAQARPYVFPDHPEWGTTYWDLFLYPIMDDAGEVDFLVFALDDVTERTRSRKKNDVTNALLKQFTQVVSRKEYLDFALDIIRGWSTCSHGGIRIADGSKNTIPYLVCTGFDERFLASEDMLSLDRDSCACTRVMTRQLEPQDRSALTPEGSFVTNNLQQFIEALTAEEQARFRGVCRRSGFLSLAVIPIRYREQVLGVLHLADRRADLFPPKNAEFLEQQAIIIGEAILRFSMEEERARLVFAVESSAEAVVITDPENGIIQYVNRAFEQMTGYAKHEVVGKAQHILDSGKHDDAFYREMREALRRDGSWRGIQINRKKDGTLYHEASTLSRVSGPSGDIINYISLKRDVTEDLRLQSIAESVNTMENIGYVFSGVRHEIGNPINSVKMLLTVLQQKLNSAPRESLQEYVDRVFAEIGRVEQLLKNLKSYNLYETQELAPLAIIPFITKFISLLREDFARKGITITTSFADNVKDVVADARALQQVLLNIMTNAADALEGRSDPSITIEVGREYGRVLTIIADNGIGMTAKQLADLFKPFYTSKQNGTGLGMVIVKKMLVKMNGTIEVNSVAGRGTVVNIFLPEGVHGIQQ
jgi:PAS domain S-box-containing protein